MAPTKQKSQQEALNLTEIFACEKDSKSVLIYDLLKDTHVRREIDMETNFMHNFQYCIVQGKRLFVVGGGDYKKVESPCLTSCFEILVAQGTGNNHPLPIANK